MPATILKFPQTPLAKFQLRIRFIHSETALDRFAHDLNTAVEKKEITGPEALQLLAKACFLGADQGAAA